MRNIFILFLFLHTLLIASTPIDGVLNWAEQGYKNFRTYPRVNRAYKLIEANKTKEAKVLLQKALEIDSHNQKAIDMMLNLCLKEQDNSCIDRYISRAKNVNLGYIYKQKAKQAKENHEYNKAIELAKKALRYRLKNSDRYFVKLIIFDSYLKQQEYQKADDFIQKDKLITYQILKWSKVSDNLGESDYAYKLASELPNKIEYLKWQVELLLKSKRYKEASHKMELLYKREPTADNKKQLLYLYSLTNQGDNIVKIYKDKLAKGCDEYALNFLLDYYKDNREKQSEILQKEYPYSCLPREKRVELSLELINRLKKSHPKKAKQISKEISKDIGMLSSEKKRLAFYQISGQKDKLVKIYKNRLARGCNEYALLYLLDYYKNSAIQRNKLLENNYPYSCLSKDKRTVLSLELLNLLSNKNPSKAKEILDRLNSKDIEPSSYINISNISAKLGEYQKSIDYALLYLKHYPDNVLAIKNIGFSYFKLGQKELSAHYLIRASKLNPSDIDLLKNIGYLCAELKEYNTAIYYWKLYLKKKNDATIQLELASLYYYQLKDYQKAQEALNRYEKLTKIYTAQYYTLKAKLAYLKRDCKVALNNYNSALEIKENDNIDYEYAHLLAQCKEEDKAIDLMQKLSSKNPDNLQYKKELAYMYEKKRDYSKAIKSFEDVAKSEPKVTNHLSLAYAYKKVGKDKEAIKEFKKAIDSSPNMDKKKLRIIKNEIKNMRRFSVYMAQTARLDGDKKGQSLSNINNSTYNGFGSIEFAYRPKFLPNRTRLFANILHDHIDIKESAQPSVGVRYQPIKDKQFFISARKLIKAGVNTRDDTLLQASLGISSNGSNSSDIYQNLYLDSGYFTKADSIIVYGNYEIGKKYNIDKNLKISPYLTTGGTFSNDNSKKREVTNMDIGVGVAVDILPDETKYEAPAYRNRLKLEARGKYAGNTKDKNTLHLQWEFFY